MAGIAVGATVGSCIVTEHCCTSIQSGIATAGRVAGIMVAATSTALISTMVILASIGDSTDDGNCVGTSERDVRAAPVSFDSADCVDTGPAFFAAGLSDEDRGP